MIIVDANGRGSSTSDPQHCRHGDPRSRDDRGSGRHFGNVAKQEEFFETRGVNAANAASAPAATATDGVHNRSSSIAIAADKSLAGGDEAAKRARTLGKEPVTVCPRTTHSLPVQAAE